MSSGKINIVLGCFGRSDDNFVSCTGIENIILVLSPNEPNYKEIMDYLDNLQLFDKMIMNYNGIRHFLHNMQERYDLPTKKLWSEKMFLLYQKFVIDNRDCGVYVKLEISNISSTPKA